MQSVMSFKNVCDENIRLVDTTSGRPTQERRKDRGQRIFLCFVLVGYAMRPSRPALDESKHNKIWKKRRKIKIIKLKQVNHKWFSVISWVLSAKSI